MPVRLVAKKNGSLQLSNKIPRHLRSYVMKGADCRAASGAFGYLLLQEATTKQFRIQYNCYCLTQDDEIHIRSDEPMLELLFNLGEPLRYRSQGLGNLSFMKTSYNIVHSPVIDDSIQCKQDHLYQTFSVRLPIDYLEFIAAYFPKANDLLQAINQGQAGTLHGQCMPAPADTLNIIHDIIMVKYSGELLMVYIMARITELLILCFEHGTLPMGIEGMRLWKADIDAIENIRKEMLENLHQAFHLSELALKAGMNKDKLAKGFKLVVGTPLFEFLLNARMNKARYLLLTTQQSISEIGFEVGYNYIHSFSKAFKKQYGMSPLQYRRTHDKGSLN